jgi:hypothetical protein
VNTNPKYFIISSPSAIKQIPVCNVAKGGKVSRKPIRKKYIDNSKGTLYFLLWLGCGAGECIVVIDFILLPDDLVVDLPALVGSNNLVNFALFNVFDSFYGQWTADSSQLLQQKSRQFASRDRRRLAFVVHGNIRPCHFLRID